MKQVQLIIYVFLFASFCTINADAKTESKKTNSKKIYSNSINISFGNYYIRKTIHERSPFMEVGGNYERKIYKNWFLGIGYMEWNTLWKHQFQFSYRRLLEENSISVAHGDYKPIINGIEERYNYKMVDFYGLYKFQIGKSSHYLNFGLGASYNWGFDTYLGSYNNNPGISYDSQYFYYSKPVTYWGGIAALNYEYYFIKNRFKIGAGYKLRYYPGRKKNGA